MTYQVYFKILGIIYLDLNHKLLFSTEKSLNLNMFLYLFTKLSF